MELLVFDVEGTLFETTIKLPGASIDSTIWQSIAHELGSEAIAEEVETHRRWERGEYRNYMAWMEATIDVHRKYGLTQHCFNRLIAAAKYNPGVSEVFQGIDRNEYEIVLISGGFRELAVRPQKDFNVKHAFAACEYIFGDNGLLKSYNLLPCDFEGKLDFIFLLLREYGLKENQWIFVGDGLNDVPIAQKAPLSIAYRGHPALRQVSTKNIDIFRDLIPILSSRRTG